MISTAACRPRQAARKLYTRPSSPRAAAGTLRDSGSADRLACANVAPVIPPLPETHGGSMHAPIGMNRAAADAARLLVRDWSEREAAVVGDNGRAHRAVIICNPDAVGASVERLGDAEAQMAAAFRNGLLERGFEGFGAAGSLAGSATVELQDGGEGIRLEVVWVVDTRARGGGAEEGDRGEVPVGQEIVGTVVEAGELKAHVWKLAAAHHHLQVCLATSPQGCGGLQQRLPLCCLCYSLHEHPTSHCLMPAPLSAAGCCSRSASQVFP